MRRPALSFALGGAVAACSVLAGCGAPSVTRIMDGRLETGPFIRASTYAFYARAAVAEASGDLDGALTAYAWAEQTDDVNPDPWVRSGALRCARSATHDAPDAPDAHDDFAKAIAMAPAFAPAYRERARCLAGQGRGPEALADATRALALDPDDLDTALVYASALRAAGRVDDAVLALRGLAARHPGTEEPLRALSDLARSKADQVLERECAASLEELERSRGEIPRGVGAVDASLRAGDLARARRHALAAHMSGAELAARAAALGLAAIAIEQAQLVLAADPSDTTARIALASGADLRGDQAKLDLAMAAIPRASRAPSPLARWLFAEVLRRRVGAAAAIAWLGARAAEAAGPTLPVDPLFQATEARVRTTLTGAF